MTVWLFQLLIIFMSIIAHWQKLVNINRGIMMFSILDAEYFVNECSKREVNIEILSNTLTLTKNFTAGNHDEYTQAESDVSIIYDVPYVKGQSSTWGTIGDGVGGYSAILHGQMRINRSSCKKTFLKAVKKLLEV